MEDYEENRIFIGKIPSGVSQDKIEKYFGQFGHITHTLFPRANGPLKIAFVSFADKQGLDKALEIRHELGGSELNVTRALPKSARGGSAASGGSESKETRIFAGQIPGGTTEDELEGYFSKWGKVIKVAIPSQSPSKEKLYAFITFSNVQEKFAALASKHMFKGIEIRVVEAAPKPESSRSEGGSYGGGGGGGGGGGSYSRGPPPMYGMPLGGPGPSSSSSSSSSDFEENPTRIFVGRLPQDTLSDELRDYFGRFGNVADVFVPGTKTRSPRQEIKGGYAFVTFTSSKELFKTLASGPHTFKGQKIEVIEAKPKGVRGSQDTPASIEPRVFVGRIPSEVVDDQLKQHFGQFGKVVDVFRPKQTPKDGTEFAFVIYSSPQDVYRALAEDKHILLGKYDLNVVRARPRSTPSSSSPSERGPPPPSSRSSRSGSREGSSRSAYREPLPDYGRELRGPPPPSYPYPEPSYDPYRSAPGPPPPMYDPYAPQPSYSGPSGYPPSNGGYSAPPSGGPGGYYDPYGQGKLVASSSPAYAPSPSSMSSSKHRYQPY